MQTDYNLSKRACTSPQNGDITAGLLRALGSDAASNTWLIPTTGSPHFDTMTLMLTHKVKTIPASRCHRW